MDKDIQNFIEQNINLIQSQRWEEIYKKEFPKGFTEALLNCGINPLEQGLNYVPDYFLKSSGIKEFIIPNNITSIGDFAFEGCNSLTSVEIGNNVTSIGYDAFDDCTSLTSVEIPNNVKSIDYKAFCNCTALTKVNYTGTIDQWVEINFYDALSNPLYYANNLYINNQLITKVVLTTATKINDDAFTNCISLTSVTIPDSVTSIGNDAFSGCYSLININYNGTKSQWDAISKYNKDWAYGVNITVYCTDGEINYNE